VIEHDTDLGEELNGHAPGETITLQVFRDGKPREVRVRLGNRPLQSPRG
jgi:S1-C subfamily serine protease